MATRSPFKKCFKCGRKLRLTEFYKHKEMSDGLLGKCRLCTCVDSRMHRYKNLKKVMAYDRNRPNRLERIIKGIKYRKTKIGRQKAKEGSARWIENNKHKKTASNRVNAAIRSGSLLKEPCAICGSENRIHGHHENYKKPLEVIWLCPEHHSLIHVDKRENERTI